ncbi:Hypothetical predicted protein [Cloeon dipterum]|uniref:Protein kinase domain-containing protein n=1 Tax=Cloeon dipterum TaxID=197152 RepID=A0A8S1BV45_9INSE|nr:Hypothetical predicted protein [Cloeon dipterum]
MARFAFHYRVAGIIRWALCGCLATLLLLPNPSAAVEMSQCIAPLGMENGAIRDEDISASSSFDNGNVGPTHGRVRTELHGGAWCPKHEITSAPREWLEINLHNVHVITASETQGRFGNGQGQEYAEAYVLEYWRPRLGKWVRYRNFKGAEVITGNENTYLEAKNDLDPPIWASKIRFLPYSDFRRTVCMRVEIYGCYYNDGIVSYSMPQGDKRGNGWEFFDSTYDGIWESDLLKRGLGMLTDGKVGLENFKLGYHDERGQGWVGWRNDTRNGKPVEIKFEFDKVREFNTLHIYCNNHFTKDIQVFAEAKVFFSVGGQQFLGDPITYTYIEDRIFETSRNISIKLHHRVGRFVKLQLHFAAKWIMISEVTFDSDIAHGNFTVETKPATDAPEQSDVYVEKSSLPQDVEVPVSSAHQEDQTFIAVVLGVGTSVVLITVVVVILARYTRRKNFASPLASKAPLSGAENNASGPSNSAYTSVTVDDNYNQPRGSTTTDRRGLLAATRADDYQEPYQALKYAPYYSYSPVVMEMKDMITDTLIRGSAPHSDTSYEYAVPELGGSVPLLNHENSLARSEHGSVFSRNSNPQGINIPIPKPPSSRTSEESSGSRGKRSPSHQQEVLKRRLEQTVVPEFPRHRLRMLTILAEGNFGKLYVAEADGIPEYGSTKTQGKRFVAVKFVEPSTSESDRIEFYHEVRIIAALEDANIARVLGMCSREEPKCIVYEYLEHGDLKSFLASHVHAEGSRTLPVSAVQAAGIKTLSFNCLLYMATQIASGMRYLESLNFVHRDLATRNCLVGVGYLVKISDFAQDNEEFAEDYYHVVKGGTALELPVRWMAWESLFLDKYTTKSDVWSFAVTLWEILTIARHQPYDHLASNQQVVDQLALLQEEEEDLFARLPKPAACPRDVYDLMKECWRRVDVERPSFREIHLFLQRKNLGYAPM